MHGYGPPTPEPEPEPELVRDDYQQHGLSHSAELPVSHCYAMLTTTGLEHILADELIRCPTGDRPRYELPPTARVSVPPPVSIPAGFGAGKAGSVSPVVVETPIPLDSAVLRHPCVSAPLALVTRVELSAAQLSSARNTAAVLLQATCAWGRAVSTWCTHQHCDESTSTTKSVDVATRACKGYTFRVGTLRGGGKHVFTSRQLDAALGAVVADSLQPGWSVQLSELDVLVICTLVNTCFTVGLLLPPFRPKQSSVLPTEPASLELGLGETIDQRTGGGGSATSHGDSCGIRPHMRPSRAAGLVRLAKLQPGSTVLDPCGGVGVLSIEVARLVTGSLAISVDLDLAACNVAASYARTAAAAVEQSCGCPEGLRGSVSVMCADMSALQLPLRAGSVDAVVVDLPFGFAHRRIDVRALLATIGVLLRSPSTTAAGSIGKDDPHEQRGGKALLLGSAGPHGTAAACSKVLKKWPVIKPAVTSSAEDVVAHEYVWEECGRTKCYSGGVECVALELQVARRPIERIAGRKDP